jgi:hypothetical protein
MSDRSISVSVLSISTLSRTRTVTELILEYNPAPESIRHIMRIGNHRSEDETKNVPKMSHEKIVSSTAMMETS